METEITTAELKQLWSLLDKMYWVLSEADDQGEDQGNNIDYYPAREYDNFFEDINSLKEIVEMALGKVEARNSTVLAAIK